MNILSQYPRLKKISGPPQLGEQSKILQSKAVSYGPGTELKKLLQELGISMKSSCDCSSHATQMNLWGVAGCRQRRETIVAWLREAATEATLRERLTAGMNGILRGIVVNPLDPCPNLVDLAIQRAEHEMELRSNDGP